MIKREIKNAILEIIIRKRSRSQEVFFSRREFDPAVGKDHDGTLMMNEILTLLKMLGYGGFEQRQAHRYYINRIDRQSLVENKEWLLDNLYPHLVKEIRERDPNYYSLT